MTAENVADPEPSEGPRHAGAKAQESPIAAAGRGLGGCLGDAVGEGLAALAGCLFLAGLIVALRWSWAQNPTLTIVLAGAVAAVGAFALARFLSARRGGSKVAPWASAVVAFLGVAGVLAAYGLAYCSCL